MKKMGHLKHLGVDESMLCGILQKQGVDRGHLLLRWDQ
jgi:hypothetical protein